MKRNILTWSLVAGFAMFSASCSNFLDEKSVTKLDESQVYSDVNLVETSLKGAYASWKAVRTDEQGLIMMMGTDETQQGALQMKSDAAKGGLDRYDGNLNSTLAHLANQWAIRWPIVNEAARIIKGLSSSPVTPGSREAKLVGEASFIRGFLDFQLAMYWGEIPIRDLDHEAELGFRRQPLKDVWAFIIADVQQTTVLRPTMPDVLPPALHGQCWVRLICPLLSAQVCATSPKQLPALKR